MRNFWKINYFIIMTHRTGMCIVMNQRKRNVPWMFLLPYWPKPSCSVERSSLMAVMNEQIPSTDEDHVMLLPFL